jgi:AraC family transcriptional regulator of adaptative response / methylphosphotriester-DNA alkyltransferase methyltransferase
VRVVTVSAAPSNGRAFARPPSAPRSDRMSAPGQPLSVTPARAGAWRVLLLRGEIDLDTASGLTAVFTRAVRDREPLAIDLCEADATDAPALALLVNAVRRLHHRRRDVVFVCPPGRVRTALEQTGVARRLTLLEVLGELYGRDIEPEPRRLEPAACDRHDQRPSTPGRRAALLAEATLAIEARHDDPTLTLSDVARDVATSSRQLQRVFSEHAGGAFRDELAAVRMQHAAVLLQTTDLTVAEVARRAGYRQAAHFAKAFRRHHGTSPSGLRRATSAEAVGSCVPGAPALSR